MDAFYPAISDLHLEYMNDMKDGMLRIENDGLNAS